MARTAILLAALCVAACAPAMAATNRHGAWSFVSAPALVPPSLAITRTASTSDGDIFLDAVTAPGRDEPLLGHAGPVIYDTSGSPVWVGTVPPGDVAIDFRAQTLHGAPVLTWWQGRPSHSGHGTGEDVIADSSYRTVAVLTGRGGYPPDFHDLQIVGGRAYVTAYRIAHADLSRVGGARHGRLVDALVEEIDIRTGRVVFEWDALRHVGLRESFAPRHRAALWDPFHINSVDVDASGNLLVSARNTSALYFVERRTGAILWRIGGKRSDFRFGPGASFAFQHDARLRGYGELSVFDNGGGPPRVERQARGLVLALDARQRTIGLVSEYRHDSPMLASNSQGDLERLPDGNVFVGWGALPYVSEFSAAGQLVFDAHLHGPDESYRAFRMPWDGTPESAPSAAARSEGGGTTVYASWNGATRVATWQVLSGPAAGVLAPVATAARAGFETAVGGVLGGPWFAVRALDLAGRVLGTSTAVLAR